MTDMKDIVKGLDSEELKPDLIAYIKDVMEESKSAIKEEVGSIQTLGDLKKLKTLHFEVYKILDRIAYMRKTFPYKYRVEEEEEEEEEED